MKKENIVTVIVLVCALGLQVLNITSQVKTQSNYKDIDKATADSYDAASVTKYYQQNHSTFTFVYAGSGISCAFYLYLIIVKAIGKSPSEVGEWLLVTSVIFLQFAIATVLAISLGNNQQSYQTNKTTLEMYQSYSITGQAVDLLVTYKQNRNLTQATMIVCYVVCFGAVLVVSAWNAKIKIEEKGTYTKKQEISGKGTFENGEVLK